MLQSRGNTGGSQPNAEDAEGPEATSENTDWNYAEHVSGEFRLTDHDRIEWVLPNEFEGYDFAPADIPFVKKLVEEYSK